MNRDILHLDWGYIDESYNPNIVSDLLTKALKKRGFELLQYNDGHGLNDLRNAVVEFLKDFFKIENISQDNVCITNGVTAGIDLVSRYILHGQFDSVYFEPAFDTAINCLKINSHQAYGIELDPFLKGELMTKSVWHQLEARLSKKTTKLLYVIPNFQNPTGQTIKTEDRVRIYKLCRKYSVYIIEDDPYKPYNFCSIPQPQSFFNFDTSGEKVIYLNSVSKIFFPGVRIGFIIANKKVIDDITEIQKYTTSSANLLMQGAVIEAIKENIIKDSFEHYYSVIKAKRELILSEMKKQKMCEVINYTTPLGGFYIWCRVKNDKINTKQKLIEAKSNGVSYVPGCLYFIEANKNNYFRLAYSQIKLEDIKEAIKRLKKTFTET